MPASSELGPDRRRRRAPEDRQRRPLGRDERDLRPLPRVPRLVRGHERELVRRQRPARPGRDDERHPPRVALPDVREQAGHPLVPAALVPRERVPVGGDRRHAGREQQGVVAQALPALGDDDAIPVVDRGDDVGHQPRAGVAGDLRHRHVPHAVAEEQVRDEERLVDEVLLGVDERELDAVAGEAVQGKERLDSGDPAAGDDDAEQGGGGHGRDARRSPRRAIEGGQADP